ncbi:MAG: hypothetical protein JXB42_11200 [Deltaproteobacteria bacterium]|nr:hypothetical protein [Deltaproteobacteria bacterium]
MKEFRIGNWSKKETLADTEHKFVNKRINPGFKACPVPCGNLLCLPAIRFMEFVLSIVRPIPFRMGESKA